MTYLADVVSMHDVKDVESFVRDAINRTLKSKLAPGETEDCIAMGLLIMCRLYARYDSEKDAASKRGRVGHVCTGPRCCVPSFAGYANFVLPKKLQEEWYSLQPEYQSRKVEGRRTYVRYESAVSIDNMSPGDDYRVTHVQDLATTRHPGKFTEVPILPKEAK